MTAKQVRFSAEARGSMLRGIEVLSGAVGVTLGPRGRNVLLEKDYGAPRITKDGVTVANDVELGDRVANMGVRLVREVASRTSYRGGDGTTTATVLTQAFVREGVKLVAAGVNPMDLKRGIDAAVAAVAADLRSRSVKITSPEQVVHIGTVSANGDAEIGRVLADALGQVGNDGVITVEQGTSMETELEVAAGMQFDRGYISTSFITDERKRQAVLDEPYILIVEKKLTGLNELLPLLDAVMETGKPLFIIADAVEGEALATLVVNTMRGSFKAAAVKAPGYGAEGKALLQDVAILTGGHAICEELGIRLENASIRLLGRAKSVRIDKHKTTIVAGRGKPSEIDARIREIKAQINETTSDHERDKLQGRIAGLACRVAILRVGGTSEFAAKERKDRVDDALNATRAAIEEGIVPGGGVALLRAARSLETLAGDNQDQQHGIDLVRRALASPARQIASNAGADGATVVGKILDHGAYGFGYDARRAEYGDLVARGIVDPTKVVRTALQAAASIAGLLIATEAVVTDLHDRVEPEGHHHHHGNMDIDF